MFSLGIGRRKRETCFGIRCSLGKSNNIVGLRIHTDIYRDRTLPQRLQVSTI